MMKDDALGVVMIVFTWRVWCANLRHGGHFQLFFVTKQSLNVRYALKMHLTKFTILQTYFTQISMP